MRVGRTADYHVIFGGRWKPSLDIGRRQREALFAPGVEGDGLADDHVSRQGDPESMASRWRPHAGFPIFKPGRQAAIFSNSS